MHPPFVEALLTLQADLRTIAGVALVWKDADPFWMGLIPPTSSEHRNPTCLRMKASPERLARCRHNDDPQAPVGVCPWVRICPFGVTEVIVPIDAGNIRLGTALIGPWRNSESDTRSDLLPFPGNDAALALARLASTAVQGFSHLRQTTPDLQDAAINTALQHLHKNAHPKLRLSELAQFAELSLSQFKVRFQKACGEAPGLALRRHLMIEAARRLCRPKTTVLQIALEMGYGDEDAFTVAFKRIHGITPGRFRRRDHAP